MYCNHLIISFFLTFDLYLHNLDLTVRNKLYFLIIDDYKVCKENYIHFENTCPTKIIIKFLNIQF